MKSMNGFDRNRQFCPGRRRFLKTAGIAGAGLVGMGIPGCSGKKVQATMTAVPVHSGKTDRVSIQALSKDSEDQEIIQAVRRVAEASTDFSWLSKGDTVFIKTVANSPNPYPATTSPLAIRGMTLLLLEKGAGKVLVGDKSGVMTVYHEKDDQDGSTREVMTTVGHHDAAVESGASVHYFEE